MPKIILLIFAVVLNHALTAQTNNENAIREVLKRQTIAWNKGDIEDFMSGYWNNDSLLFIGKNGPKYGYSTTLSNYKKNYPDVSAMGKLDFELLKVKLLSDDYAFVVGKWHLQRTAGDLSGSFTLLFKKINNNWYIITDHSS